jgi:hypothetical protein
MLSDLPVFGWIFSAIREKVQAEIKGYLEAHRDFKFPVCQSDLYKKELIATDRVMDSFSVLLLESGLLVYTRGGSRDVFILTSGTKDRFNEILSGAWIYLRMELG